MNESIRLYNILLKNGYEKQMNEVFEKDMCDIEPSFLGFMDIYKHLAKIIPTNMYVLDFGMAYGFQGWYFRNHRGYVGIDVGKNYLPFEWGYYYTDTTIKDFLAKDSWWTENRDSCFAICSYVPDWGGDNIKLVKDNYEDCFTYYPKKVSTK